MEAAWDARIDCFDIDFIQTGDGYLLCTHPNILAEDLRRMGHVTAAESLSALTLEELRSMGVDEKRYPLLEAVLTRFAELAERDGRIVRRRQAGSLVGRADVDYDAFAQRPFIAVDFKGGALSLQSVRETVQLAFKLGIESHLVFWAAGGLGGDNERAKDVAKQIASSYADDDYNIIIGHGYKDIDMDPATGKIVPSVPPVTEEDVALFGFLGPSINLPTEWFHEIRAHGKLVICWTINTEAQMRKSFTDGTIHAGFSDFPLAYQSAQRAWVDRGCRDDFFDA